MLSIPIDFSHLGPNSERPDTGSGSASPVRNPTNSTMGSARRFAMDTGLAETQSDYPNRNRFPTSWSSTAMCRYVDVMLTFACPAASRTSASVLPPASAWLMNVWRPW